jgi:hypothetical protein
VVWQGIFAAEFPQQIDGRPAHGGVGRALQPLHGLPARRAEGDEERREPLARTAALLGRKGLGERAHEHVAHREAQLLDAFELRLVDGRQMRHDVPHHRAAGELLDRPRRRRLASGRAVRARFGHQHGGQLLRGVEVADQQLVFNLRDDRPHQVAPPDSVLLDAQQIEQQREVEPADFADGHGTEPRMDPFRVVVADALDFDRLTPCARQLRGRTRRIRTMSPYTTSASPRRWSTTSRNPPP